MEINMLLNFADGNTWLGIILFFVGLGILVTIHELGHFIAAKSFNVYCSDFSIGFGPKIVKIKRKKGETKFSIGIVPLGGYVSMYGEESDELPEGVVIPKFRSIAGISRWKRFIIFGAGIVMNFVLAYVVFFVACLCFPHYDTYGSVVDLVNTEFNEEQSKLLVFDSENNRVEDISFLSIDNNLKNDFKSSTFFQIETRTMKYKYGDREISFNALIQTSNFENYSEFTINPYQLNFDDGATSYVISYNTSNFGINNIDFASYFTFYKAVRADDEKISNIEFYDYSLEEPTYVEYSGDLSNVYLPVVDEKNNTSKLPFNEMYNGKISGEKLITFKGKQNGENKIYNATLVPYFKNNKLTSFNLHMYQYSYWLKEKSFGEAGYLWTRSTSLIANALGNLFIGRGWDNVGGPVAMLNATTTQLISNPFYIYLYNWGMISVNLALFNLIPFPGLDGWQILVEIIEGIVNSIKKAKFKKKHKDDAILDAKIVSASNGEEVNATKEEATLSIGSDTKEAYVNWKIPAKVKGIVSYVGLGLLFLLAIVIFVFDIIKMF